MKRIHESHESPRKQRRFGVWCDERVAVLCLLLVAVVGVLAEQAIYLNGPARLL